jgi:hypothetical protein
MSGELNHLLPRRYHQNYLVLMVQEPGRLYAYWEITPERLVMTAHYLQQTPENLSLAIRLSQRGGGSGGETACYPITDLCGQSYFSGFPPHHIYQAELGVLQAEGGFLALLCSEQVMLPVMGDTYENPRRDTWPNFPAAFFHRS